MIVSSTSSAPDIFKISNPAVSYNLLHFAPTAVQDKPVLYLKKNVYAVCLTISKKTCICSIKWLCVSYDSIVQTWGSFSLKNSLSDRIPEMRACMQVLCQCQTLHQWSGHSCPWMLTQPCLAISVCAEVVAPLLTRSLEGSKNYCTFQVCVQGYCTELPDLCRWTRPSVQASLPHFSPGRVFHSFWQVRSC